MLGAGCESLLRAAGTRCLRRPFSFYGQCRPAADECTEWTHKELVVSEDGWLCPGWEQCSAPYEECTLSRCCQAEGYSCLLNRTAADRRAGRWTDARGRLI